MREFQFMVSFFFLKDKLKRYSCTNQYISKLVFFLFLNSLLISYLSFDS